MADRPELDLSRDRDILEQFLLMFRDYYRAADEATYFLEAEMGISNIHGIANLRDAMSHFAAFLNCDDGSKRRDHLVAAEEHVRRAIVEAYETGLDALIVKFEPLYEEYLKSVLPAKDRHRSLADAPNRLQIDAALRTIRRLEEEGRSVKTKRLWEPEWGVGTFGFVEAFRKLKELYSNLQDYNRRYEDLRLERKNTWLHVWGIAATIVVGILGAILAYVLATK